MARKASRKQTGSRGTTKKATAAKRAGSAPTGTTKKASAGGRQAAKTRKSATAKKRAGTRTAPARKAAAARKTQASRTAAKKTARKGAAKTRPASTRKTAATKARKLDTPTARERNAARSTAARRRRQAPAPEPASRLATAAALVRGAVSGAVTAVVDKLAGTAAPDALQMLEQDHRRFEDLLRQGEETTERARTTRKELLDTLTSELAAHELKEEKILYPALESHPESREIVLEGYEEHHVADAIITELHDVATDDEGWAAKFKVLKENLEHHIQEEEGEMFRLARGIFSKDELQELGERMRELTAQS